MQETRLVQRLNAPPKKTGSPLDNAHRVFGGGMLQLGEKAWDLFDEFCTIDYMGAAEYEFGAFPTSLREFGKDADKLIEFEFVIKAKEIEAPYWRRHKEHKHKDADPAADRTIHVICREEHKAEVKKRIKQMAKNKLSIKCGSLMSESLDPEPGRDRQTLGWYELNNGFFFTIDKAMFAGFKGIFMPEGAS